ncbi:hypothetical protein RRG08_017713 [Elysia crispata]|uniref:Uncharacterized protein n=1 Tax=Elysia crispata TaxID=231223 RepID=A0AAE0YI38_9GAST|nr:hypothetical protein RRG08_017713 [Elysia crispata]
MEIWGKAASKWFAVNQRTSWEQRQRGRFQYTNHKPSQRQNQMDVMKRNAFTLLGENSACLSQRKLRSSLRPGFPSHQVALGGFPPEPQVMGLRARPPTGAACSLDQITGSSAEYTADTIHFKLLQHLYTSRKPRAH